MIYLVLLLSLLLRFALMPLPPFGTDMSCWLGWSNQLLEVGPRNFYSGTWSDYLPSYLYVLWFLAFLNSKLPLLPYEMLLKLPANLADIGIGWLIFNIVKKSSKKNVFAVLVASLYLFNPFSLFNSSVWGQVDAVFTFFLFLSSYLIIYASKKQFWLKYSAWALLGIALLFKPQTLFFLPILMIWEIRNNDRKTLIKYMAVFVLTIIFLSLPFFPNDPAAGLIDKVFNSADTYPYTTVNAMNFWGVFSNWKPDNLKTFGVELLHWGGVFMVTGIFLSWYVGVKKAKKGSKKEKQFFYFSLALIAMSYFILPTRVHERWLFPFFPFFLTACALINDKKLWVKYILLSFIHFLNLYYAYTLYTQNSLKITWITDFLEQGFGFLSFINTLIYMFIMYYGLNNLNKDNVAKKTEPVLDKNSFWNFFE